MPSPRSGPTAGAGPHRGPYRPVRICVALAALSAVLMTLVALAWSPLISFDESVAGRLHEWAVRQPAAVQVNRVLTDWFWDPWTMRALAAVAFGVLWWRRERTLAVWFAVGATTGTLLQQVLKAAVDRPRPSWPDPVDSARLAAFPSGHAMTATVVCGLLVWVAAVLGTSRRLMRWVTAVAVVSVVGVGLTRLYLGVHWPTDVLAGWLMGSFWVLLTIVLYERFADGRRRAEG
ncbi:phosphatase PAP2 family protein [Streptomyces sp. NPDC000594]|uniref:phosphatase PAP2 family protein n=1 Tax=Streptomyces sp. NPDC000594 TaxID=3154261 RepID=UPI003316E990